jgi:hypothetical protein
MKKTILTAGTVLLLAGGQLLAADELSLNYRDQNAGGGDESSSGLFRDQELSLDVFGTDTLGRHTIKHPSADRIRNNSVLGAGAGLNVFFCRFLGIGGDAYTENTAHNFIDNASGSLILRFPIDVVHLAPYVYGGGGYKFDPVDTRFAQAGGGLEFRLTRNLGIFADARYVFADRIADYGVGRAGVRISF